MIIMDCRYRTRDFNMHANQVMCEYQESDYNLVDMLMWHEFKNLGYDEFICMVEQCVASKFGLIEDV